MQKVILFVRNPCFSLDSFRVNHHDSPPAACGWGNLGQGGNRLVSYATHAKAWA